MNYYRVLYTVTGLFALVLSALLLLAPRIYLSLYVPNYDPAMAFAAQRLAPAVSGLGVLLLLARDLPDGAFAARFAGLAALVWFGVAGTGVFHFATGVATPMILTAAVSEATLGVLFLIAARGKSAR
ncbi:hypothetical protein [Gymnodinialimonas sp. 57CJ19]|uniref:hypothetical protein n=1 Tax=Gymnodinialimonas sp. 57CJ19 TaxID=3138498 RepID=UPI0031343028